MYIVLSDYENQSGAGLPPLYRDSSMIAVLDTEDMVVSIIPCKSLKKLIWDNGRRIGHPDGHVEIYWDKLRGMHYVGNGTDYSDICWMVDRIWLPSLEDRFKFSLLSGEYSIRDTLIRNNETGYTLDFVETFEVLSLGLGHPDIKPSNFEMLTGVGFFDLPAKKFKVQLKTDLGLFIDLHCNPQTFQILQVDIWLRFVGARYKTYYSFNVTGDFKKYMARYILAGRSGKCT